MSGTNSSIFGKFIITALVVAWAIGSMVPFGDTPFEDYIKTRATANQQEFVQVLKEKLYCQGIESIVNLYNKHALIQSIIEATRQSLQRSISHFVTLQMQRKLTCRNILKTSTFQISKFSRRKMIFS